MRGSTGVFGLRRRAARLRRVLRVAALSVASACGRRDRPPPPERPSQPTLTIAPGITGDAAAPATGRRVVAAGQIAQPWHIGAWSPASITLADVAAGDAIVALGVYWGDLEAGSSTVPTDDRGALRCVIDHGPAIVGRKKPPVFAQLCVELDAQPGAHTLIPPYLGGPAGDGTFYVAQIRGLTEHRVITSGQRRVTGEAITGVSVALDGASEPGDLLVALAGYDNVTPRASGGWSHPPPGWRALGLQDDAANNVPSELCYRVAPSADAHAVAWTWTDPTVNVAAAVIAALR